MAKATTTTASAITIGDATVSVASATGIVANMWAKVDDEWFRVASTYTTGVAIPVLRGQNGSATVAHVSGANFTFGTGSDFADQSATVIVPYPLSALRRKVVSYSAAGAIALPSGGEDVIAVINGTSAFAMTLAVPGKDIDGTFLYIASNGKAAHTVTLATALGNAGSGYTVATFTTGAQQTLALMAVNGIWQQAQSQFSGTLTNVLIALA